MAATPEKRYNFADYLTSPEGVRWELIDGVIFDMTPTPGTVHQSICGELLLGLSLMHTPPP